MVSRPSSIVTPDRRPAASGSVLLGSSWQRVVRVLPAIAVLWLLIAWAFH